MRPTDRKVAIHRRAVERLLQNDLTIEQNDNQMTRVNRSHLAFRNNFRFAIGRENKALASFGGLPCFNAINAIASEQFVRVAEDVVSFLALMVKGNLPFLLRNIEAETGFVHDVTRQARHVFRSRERRRLDVLIDSSRINEARLFHLERFRQRVHLAYKNMAELIFLEFSAAGVTDCSCAPTCDASV